MSSKNSIIFQALNWEKEDIFKTNYDDYGNGIPSEEDSDYEDFDRKNQNERELIIRIYGLTQKGESVCLEITGFQPYFLLKLPENFSKSDIRLLKKKIRKSVPEYSSYLSFNQTRMKKLYYFDGGKFYDYLKISFSADCARWGTMKKIVLNEQCSLSPGEIRIQKTIEFDIRGKKIDFDVYETRIDTIIRLIHVSNILPCGIIRAKNLVQSVSNKKINCKFVKSCNYRDLENMNGEEWVAPFKISSYDIECTSCDGSFPQAKRASDKIIQIGTTTRNYGEKNCRVRHIVTLKKCAKIKNISEDEITVVRSVNSEKDLLKVWKEHIRKIDPDVIIGYNIFGFDWKYLYDRAKFLGIEKEFSKFGRIQGKECRINEKPKKLSSSAMGHNELYYPNISGRLQIDLLPVIRNEHNLNSYKLDNVSFKFMKSRKNDLSPQELFRNFKEGKPENIKTIAEYCIQDCVLVNDLFDKLDIFINNLSMANVCLIPMTLLFTRGQGIKVFSKITKTCYDRKTSFPTLVKSSYSDKGTIGYEGAIVLDPDAGFYDNQIAVLDYASLYPSSILEYNISYETIIKERSIFEKINISDKDLNNFFNTKTNQTFKNKTKNKNQLKRNAFKFLSITKKLELRDQYIQENMIDQDNNKEFGVVKEDDISIEGYRTNLISYYPKNSDRNIIGKQTCVFAEKLNGEKGIIPSLLNDLLSARKAAKKQMKQAKDPFKKSVYNGKQLALKITANSVYGYTGARFSDLIFLFVAASTTAVGRSRIYAAKNLAEKNFKGTKVVYGDTDSIFLDLSSCPPISKCRDDKKMAEIIKYAIEIANFITSKLKKPQILEYEKVFYPFLIFSKKRYVGEKFEFDPNKSKRINMGTISKRRDNALIAKIIYNGVIDELFEGVRNKFDKKKIILNAKNFYKQCVINLLKGNVKLEDLIISKRLTAEYKNPTQITHKVLAVKMSDRDPGNAPSSNERIPYIFIDPKELKCFICKKTVNHKKCKCSVCMKIFCVDHLRSHKKDKTICVPRCRICFTKENCIICPTCNGGFCMKHRFSHKRVNANGEAKCMNIKEEALQGDLTETPEFIKKNKLKINYRYYLDKQIINPVTQIFDLLKEKDVIGKILIKDTNKRKGIKSITDFFSKKGLMTNKI